MRRAVRHLIIAAALLGARGASAQPSDPAAAQTLFDDAKQLMAEGKVAEACPKFLASFKLDPKPGAAVNLADCYEKNGQTASAWVRFREAAALAERAGQSKREKYANEHAAALEPTLSRLTIAVPSPTEGLEVMRDGTALDRAVWGTAVPVDPDTYVIEARAPGKKAWSTRVVVGSAGARARVEVPALNDAPKAPVLSEQPPPVVLDQPPPPEGGLGGQRIAGIAIGVAGLAGIGIGSAFGAMAMNKWRQAKPSCAPTESDGTAKCSAAGVKLVGEAKSAAAVSTGLFVAGGALVAAGIVVLVTAPTRKAAPIEGLWLVPGVGPGGVGLAAQGAF